MTYNTTIPKHKTWWKPILFGFALVLSACIQAPESQLLGTQPVYAQGRAQQGRGQQGRGQQGRGQQGSQLAQNPGFEDDASPVPRFWTWDQNQSGNKGTVSVDRSRNRSGRASLKLSPNNRNVTDNPLGITQIIPAAQYRGKKVEFSGYMITEGDTQGILAMMSIVRGAGTAGPDMLFQNRGGSGWTEHRKVYTVPDDPTVQIVLMCMSNGKSGATWFDDLSIVPVSDTGGNVGQPDSQPSQPSQPALNAKVNVDAASVVRTIPRTLYGANIEYRWNGLNLWQEKERRLDPRLIKLTKDLGVSLLRYPGGYYADFYHWKSGVGPIDRRPVIKYEPSRDDRARDLFGTDEALTFARESGSEIQILVNAGTGTVKEAAEWVKYVNGQKQQVRFWEIGNELYIKNSSIESKMITIDPQTYAKRYGEFARAMRAVDPTIKLMAIGGENYGPYNSVSFPNWLKTVIEQQAEQIDFIAVHNAYAPLPLDDNADFRTVYKSMLAAPVLVGRNLQTVSDIIAKYAPKRASQIKIAVTEWGPAFRFNFDSKFVDHAKTLGSALFSASMMKTFIESPKVDIANLLMLHDISVYGAIGSRNLDFPPNSDWFPTARYYALQLYTKHFGTQLLKSTSESPTFDTQRVGLTDAVKGAPYLDVVSSLSADGRQLYIIAINKHFDQPIDAEITLRSFVPLAQATAWTLNGTGIDANLGTGIIRVPGLEYPKQREDRENPRFFKGGDGEITFLSSEFKAAGSAFTYRFPAHSATSLVLTRR